MDLSKAERQAPAEQRRSKDPNSLRTLLQYILCSFVLISISLLILAVIFCVVSDVNRVRKQNQHRQRDHVNGTRSDGQVRRFFQRRFTWLRLVNCQKPQQKQPIAKQDQGQEQPAEPQTIGPQSAPTYQPIYHPELHRQQAGGDHVKTEAAGSEPQPITADEQWNRNLMQWLL